MLFIADPIYFNPAIASASIVIIPIIAYLYPNSRRYYEIPNCNGFAAHLFAPCHGAGYLHHYFDPRENTCKG